EATAERVLADDLPPRTPSTLSSPTRLGADLERIRVRGVAFDHAESYDGLGCIAAPIRNSGRAIGAVSVTGPIDEIDWHAHATLVQHAATSIWNERFGRRSQPSNWARTVPSPVNVAS